MSSVQDKVEFVQEVFIKSATHSNAFTEKKSAINFSRPGKPAAEYIF